MPVIRDPDFINYGEYDVNSPPIDPYTASKNNPGQPAQLLIDYDDRKFALTSPKYGSIGAGNTTLVGYGGTGGVSGQALYSKFKQIWKEDNTAVKFPFPMEAITPESFEFINGWEPDDTTELDYFTTQGITTTAAITRKLIKDCGWAERTTVADGNILKRKYFGVITLGAISRPLKDTFSSPPIASDFEDARIYCSQLNPSISTSFGTGDIDGSNRIVVLGPSAGVSNDVTVPDMWTGSSVVYQQPTSENQGIGITHNEIYFIRYATSGYLTGQRPGDSTVGVLTTTYRLTLHPTQLDALNNTNIIPLTTGAGTSVGTLRHQSLAPDFFYNITEEGGAANEPFKFYETGGAPAFTILYNYDNYFKIYCREKGRTYADQAISQVGVTQINYQAYRIPLATAADANIQVTGAEVPDSDVSNEGNITYAGIGVSFFQEPQSISINNVPYNFNCIVDANNSTLAATYQKIQYLLRNPDRINANTSNAGIGFTSINSLSAVGGPAGVGVGAGTSYGNDLRYGKTEDLLLEFIGTNLFAKLRDDLYNESGGSNYGIFIANVKNDDLNSVFYYDNTGTLREQPFVSSFNLVFNTNLNEDGDARFWVFFNTSENVPGLSTAFTIDAAAVEGVTDGIDATTNEFVVGAGVSHPFVNGQEVVAIGTVSDPGIGITCDTLTAGITTFQVDRAGTTYYSFNILPANYAGRNISSTAQNPELFLYAGDTAEFDLDTLGGGGGNHPFYIKEGNALIEGSFSGGTTGAVTNDRVVGNGATTGIVTFTPTADLANDGTTAGKDASYYYICGNHPAMRGNVKILDKKQDSAFKYYVNAQKSAGVGQTYPDITEDGVHLSRVGFGVTTRFKLHTTYLDAVANGGVGINTIALNVSTTNTGLVTFTQVDVNYEENNATVVRASGQQQPADGGPLVYIDGLDVPADGEFGLTFDYDFNAQRDRQNGTDANCKVVAIGLEKGQFISQDFTITKQKGQTVQVSGALERVYSDPANN